jgi:hypothetical protein
MTQTGWLILTFKITLISGFISLLGWVILYSLLENWWRHPIGRTLVAKTTLVAALFVPSILSLFFHLSGNDSRLVGWIDVGLVGLVTPTMIWRSVVWIKLHRAGRLPRNRYEEGT